MTQVQGQAQTASSADFTYGTTSTRRLGRTVDRPRTDLELVRIHNVDIRWSGRERKDTTIVVEREQEEKTEKAIAVPGRN